jgi:hypothetical protein
MSTSNPAPLANRCQYRSHSGRQCRSSVALSGSLLCNRHAAAQSSDSVDFSVDLIREGEHFQQAQQINHSLISLYKLVAAGRISSRRASVLAYIAHLILTTHKAIDYDNTTRAYRRIVDPAQRPVLLTVAEAAALSAPKAKPRAKPLPATAEAFATEALNRVRNSTS